MLITISVEGFTQTEKNMIHAATSAILAANGISHAGIKVKKDGEIDITSPSSDPTSLLTAAAIKAKIKDILDANAAADAANAGEKQARAAERDQNPIKDMKLAEADAAVDNASEAELRGLVKQLYRWVIANSKG